MHSPAEIVEKIDTHTFLYSWPTVIKSFWTKYPNPHMSYVKFNNVIDMEIIDSEKIKIKPLKSPSRWQCNDFMYITTAWMCIRGSNVLLVESMFQQKTGSKPAN